MLKQTTRAALFFTIASLALSGRPSGFSLDASLTMFASSRPNSRATSEIGLPP